MNTNPTEATATVPLGRHFRAVGDRWCQWLALRILYFPSERRPYVQLQRVGPDHERKTVALGALLDRRLYLPVELGG